MRVQACEVLKIRVLAKNYLFVAGEILKIYRFQIKSLKQKILENISGDEVYRINTVV